MIGALYSGISGLNANQDALNTQSNNLSNVNTVGYKSDKISFADMMYQNSVGKGTSVSTIDKNFTQGNLKSTGGEFDLAIEGKGYFILKGNTQSLSYSRSGNFRMGENGTLQAPSGYKIQGVSSSISNITSTNADEQIFTSQYSNFLSSKVLKSPDSSVITTINAKSTNYNDSAKDDLGTQSGNNYKLASTKIQDVEAVLTKYRTALSEFSSANTNSVSPTFQSSEVSFNKSLLAGISNSISITINGNKVEQDFEDSSDLTLNALSDKISKIQGLTSEVDSTGKLTIKSLIPGEIVAIKDAVTSTNRNPIERYSINTTDAISGSGQAKLDVLAGQLKTLIERADGKYISMTNVVDTSDTQNLVLNDLQLKLTNLKISDNQFGQTEIDNGVIYIKQGDTRFAVGKVMISAFTSEEGLVPMGSNMYSKSAKSGEPVFANNMSKINNKMLELSNTSLSEGLVDLMIYQRAFEANSKSITTSDEFLKTAIQLKK